MAPKNATSTEKNRADGADGHTNSDGGRPNEKLGETSNSEASNDSDEELTKVDTTAQRGVQNAQAMTYVWSKRDLILAYIV